MRASSNSAMSTSERIGRSMSSLQTRASASCILMASKLGAGRKPSLSDSPSRITPPAPFAKADKVSLMDFGRPPAAAFASTVRVSVPMRRSRCTSAATRASTSQSDMFCMFCTTSCQSANQKCKSGGTRRSGGWLKGWELLDGAVRGRGSRQSSSGTRARIVSGRAGCRRPSQDWRLAGRRLMGQGFRSARRRHRPVVGSRSQWPSRQRGRRGRHICSRRRVG